MKFSRACPLSSDNQGQSVGCTRMAKHSKRRLLNLLMVVIYRNGNQLTKPLFHKLKKKIHNCAKHPSTQVEGNKGKAGCNASLVLWMLHTMPIHPSFCPLIIPSMPLLSSLRNRTQCRLGAECLSDILKSTLKGTTILFNGRGSKQICWNLQHTGQNYTVEDDPFFKLPTARWIVKLIST